MASSPSYSLVSFFLLPVITQGREVMPVLAATRQASYVSRSSVGNTCSTWKQVEHGFWSDDCHWRTGKLVNGGRTKGVAIYVFTCYLVKCKSYKVQDQRRTLCHFNRQFIVFSVQTLRATSCRSCSIILCLSISPSWRVWKIGFQILRPTPRRNNGSVVECK